MSTLTASSQMAEDSKIKTVVEERVNEDGKRVRVTRRIRMRLVTTNVSPQVAARMSWPRFNDAAVDAELNSRCTRASEPVHLHLSMGKRRQNQDGGEVEEKKPSVEVHSIVCRYCQGAHWSAKCPYKATFAEDSSEATSAGATTAEASAGGSKYIPPAMRARMEAGSTPIGGSFAGGASAGGASSRDNPNTVRLSNLSEICTETDLRDLCSRIAPVARVYVVKDKRTFMCRGSAFVSFHSMMEAERAVQILNGHPYGNLILRAEIAKPQE